MRTVGGMGMMMVSLMDMGFPMRMHLGMRSTAMVMVESRQLRLAEKRQNSRDKRESKKPWEACERIT